MTGRLLAWLLALGLTPGVALPAVAAVQEPLQAAVVAADAPAPGPQTPPPPDAGWRPVALPDDAARSRPGLAMASAWYRIDFDGPGSVSPETAWAVYLPYLYDGGDLWLNGTLLTRAAQSTDRIHARSYRPQMVAIPAPTLREGRNTLEVRVSPSPSYPMRFPVVSIGPQEDILPLHDRRLFWTRTVPEITVVVSLLTALLMGFIWWRRREELLYGLFALAAALWGIRTMTFVIEALPVVAWEWWRIAYHCATGGFVVVMALFTLRFTGFRRPWIDRVLVGYWLVGPAWFALQGFAAEPLIARWWLGGMMPIGLMIVVLAAWYVVKERSATAIILAVAMTYAVLVGIHDYLITWDTSLLGRLFPTWVGHRIFLLHYGSNTLLLAMGALLTGRFVRTLGSLEDLNRTLESRVADRERALADNYARLSSLEREHAAAEERQLIMRELHDGLGSQLFTSLSRVERGDMSNVQIASALRGCIADMRLALDALASDPHDVGASLADFMFRWDSQLSNSGVHPQWNIDLPSGSPMLSPHVALQLLRIAQEALTNVLKHARASTVSVCLRREGDDLRMTIEDDGQGLHAVSGHHGGRGMSNMRARTERLGGRLDIASGRRGTRVVLRMPVT